MSTRNKDTIIEIVQALGDLVTSPHEARKQLERHYADSLLIVAGTTAQVAKDAKTFRIFINGTECGKVLDYIALRKLAGVHIDVLSEVTGKLYPHRFVEPER